MTYMVVNLEELKEKRFGSANEALEYLLENYGVGSKYGIVKELFGRRWRFIGSVLRAVCRGDGPVYNENRSGYHFNRKEALNAH